MATPFTMSPVARTGTPRQTQAERLRAALTERQMAKRALARALVGSTDERPIKNALSQISRWLSGANGINDTNAVRLARAFDPPYPDSHFLRGDALRRTVADELAAMRGQLEQQGDDLAEQRRTIQRLHRELREQRKAVTEVAEQIKKPA